jgi:hypothetical protein
MAENIKALASGKANKSEAYGDLKVFQHLYDRLSSQALTTAGLVIKAGGGVLAKTGGSTTYLLVDGKYATIGAGTDMAALTGCNFDAGMYNVAVFLVENGVSGNVYTMLPGTQGATAAGVKFPAIPAKKAVVGFAMITYASAFTGGTTALDTATTVYVSPVGAVDPSATY